MSFPYSTLVSFAFFFYNIYFILELINNVVLVSGVQQNDLVTHIQVSGRFPDAQTVKNLPTMQVNQGSIPGSGRSPGEENGNLLQYSCLENSMDQKKKPSGLQSMELQRVRHNQVTNTHEHIQVSILFQIIFLSKLLHSIQ